MSSSPTSRSRRIADTAAISVFALVVWLPTGDWLFGLDNAPAPQEKRALAKKPGLGRGQGGIVTYPKRYEAYFNDHFGYRKRLIRWHNRWRAKWFGAPPTWLVLVGKDGWLYYVGARAIDCHRGIDPFSDADLAAWQAALEGMRDRSAELGARFLFVVAPNKHTIYPEHLPDWVNARVDPKSRLDQLAEHMAASSDVAMLDLQRALLDAKKAEAVYHSTDTHWNALGAHVAYTQILSRLGEWFPGLSPRPVREFRRETGFGTGDLVSMAGRDDPAEESPLLTPTSGWRAARADAMPSVPRKQWTRGAEPVVMENADAPAVNGKRLRVVVFRDSFCSALIPFLSEHFGRSVYIWQYPLDETLVESERPDVVILHIVERSLMNIPPAGLLPGTRSVAAPTE